MDTNLSIVSVEHRRLRLVSPIVRGNPVAEELAELHKKPEVQRHEEKLKEIDNLHEPTSAINTRADWLEANTPVCAECWTLWPCHTHQIIHPDCENCDVHRI